MLGLAAYVITEVPRTLPRNIGRKLALAHAAPYGSAPDGTRYASLAEREADRISGDVRKVLRHAGFDLRERHRRRLEEVADKVRKAESKRAAAAEAQKALDDILARVETERTALEAIDLQVSD